jgi:hypothetical protein
MGTSSARTQGANARVQGWDDLAEDRGRTRGNWLPLDALNDEELYAGTPQLHAHPAPRRESQPNRGIEWLRPTAPQQRPQQQIRAAQPAQATRPQQQQQVTIQGIPVKTLGIAAGVAVFALVAYIAVSSALEWTRVKLDDLQYGRPRTVQMDAYVGHSEAEGMPSHFIAMNLNRRVTIVQLPGGDSTKASVIQGPYLFGQGEDLTPVQLNAQDVNADQKPDLVVSVKSEQLLYLNEGASFRLATADELAAIQKAASNKLPSTNGTGTLEGGVK